MKPGLTEVRKVAFNTLGCKTNQYDTAEMAGLFRERGYRVVKFDEDADVYVINTCAVTTRSEAKSRQVIRSIRRKNPFSIVAVVGCYPQVDPDGVSKIPGVDLVVGIGNRDQIVDLVELASKKRTLNGQHACPMIFVEDVFKGERELSAVQSRPQYERTRAVVKVQEGCSEFCTYCIVPFARGRLRSKLPEQVVQEVRELIKAGFKEIVLTGTHLGAYGKGLDRNLNITSLLRELLVLPGEFRVRLSSIEPMDVDDELIQIICSEPKACRHLHLPLQSGSDKVLAEMGRRYTTEQFAQLVEKARKIDPNVGITTDVMVGFPGETDIDFEATLNFVSLMRFSRVHVFRYSRRPGTRASRMTGQVPAAVAAKRAKVLEQLCDELSLGFHRRFLNKVVTVLAEEERDKGTNKLQGLTSNYIRVYFDGGDENINLFVPVMITEAETDKVFGVLQQA